MKRNEINIIFQFLGSLKLTKIADKEARNTLISNHLKLYKLAEDFDRDIKEVQKKFFEGQEDAVQEYNALVEKGRAAEAKPELISLVAEYNAACTSLAQEEVDVQLSPMEQDAFLEALEGQDVDFNIADLYQFKKFGLIK